LSFSANVFEMDEDINKVWTALTRTISPALNKKNLWTLVH